jgi:serine/threonine-protein kinase
MELPKPAEKSLAPAESASDHETPASGVSLFLRLWSYGGPSQPAASLPLQEPSDVTLLIDKIIAEGKGAIAERRPELIAAHFDHAATALSTAKALQQQFLTFHRKTEPQQVVLSILIYAAATAANSAEDAGAPEDMLANVTSAQILVAASIYEQVKSVPGMKFSPRPVREAGESFGPEAIYELLWTDESTYGHLRRAGRAGIRTVGRYQIQEELGRGAMGAVFRAYDEVIGRTVALKTIAIDRNHPDRADLLERLKQEAKAAGGLDHPNIITIYDVGEEDGIVYLSMQFVKGTTLAAMLADVGVPSLPVFLSWADQISAAVGFAHARGVIHRDLKPSNLMVTEEGAIKVLDFGIAKLGNTSLTQTGLVVGTPCYMSPELVAGKRVDHRADIFALGSVLYELVTREKPFRGDMTAVLYKIVHEDPVAPSLINPAVPGGIDAVIRKALAKDPKQRFQTCEEMRKAFLEQGSRLNSLASSAATAPPVGPKTESPSSPTSPPFLVTEPAPKPSKAGPKLALSLMLVLAGIATWAYSIRSRTGSLPPAVKTVVGAMQEVPQTLQGVKPSAGTGPASANPVGEVNPPNATAAQPPLNYDAAASPARTPVDTPAASQESVPGDAAGSAQPPASAPPAAAASTEASPPTALSNGRAPSIATLQPVAARPANTTEATTNSATGSGGTANSDSDASATNAENPIPATAPAEKPKPQGPRTFDGFSRKDIPQLLHLAEVASARGDYRLARYEYNLILKLDRGNAMARKGLQLVHSDQSSP